MYIIARISLFIFVLLLLNYPAVGFAAKSVQASLAIDVPAGLKQEPVLDPDLVLTRDSFARFAKTKIQQLNRNHRISRSRMEVTMQADGTYRGRYHQIDDTSLNVKVRRSSSKTIPFVGVVSYTEQVFESSAGTPEQLGQSPFRVVKVIPNRHIFSYQKGSWN